MKTLIQVILVALIVGGLSAGGSFYFQYELAKRVAAGVEAKVAAEKSKTTGTNESAKTADDNAAWMMEDLSADDDDIFDDSDLNKEPDHSPADVMAEAPPAGIRPPWDEGGDVAGELINKLRARMRASSSQEQRMTEREQSMNLIINDMRFEQAKSAKMRSRLLTEIKRANRTIDTIQRATAAEKATMQSISESERNKLLEEKTEERRVFEEQLERLQREKEETLKAAEEKQRKMLDPPQPLDRSGSPEETSNLKNLVAAMNSMDPAESAKILKELVEREQVAGAVAILNAMNARKRAKVITAITEQSAELAADLVERLKRLKIDGK